MEVAPRRGPAVGRIMTWSGRDITGLAAGVTGPGADGREPVISGRRPPWVSTRRAASGPDEAGQSSGTVYMVVQRGGRSYFYLCERIGGHVRTTYLGSGEEAEAIEQAWAEERAEGRERIERLRARAKAARQALIDEARELDRRADRACDLAGRALEAAGFRRHKRGEWRRARTMADPGSGLASRPDEEGRAEIIRELEAAFEPMRPGHPGAAAESARHFELVRRQGPEACRLAIKVHRGDPLALTEAALIARYAGESHLRREATALRLEELRADLAGPGPITGLERLLIDEATLGWLAWHEASDRARRMVAGLSKVAEIEMYQRMEDRAHRRFLGVLKALEQVRRKALPSLQINVATTAPVGVMVAGESGRAPALEDLPGGGPAGGPPS